MGHPLCSLHEKSMFFQVVHASMLTGELAKSLMFAGSSYALTLRLQLSMRVLPNMSLQESAVNTKYKNCTLVLCYGKES
jgi:hypothetical protein